MIADYASKIKVAIFQSFFKMPTYIVMKIVVKLRTNLGKNCAF